ncbi:MAG: TIGR03087 family PEP-CTERM/XrtA system glycosyltransferase [Phycisphaerae bacterium]|nr:TIGR03087 family PEP-CTERM/XrtA system glycosyltransferase [Phycisphaerae bacterium]
MRRLLFIAHRLPYPPDKGDRVRAFQEIKALGRDFEVVVAAPMERGQASAAADLAPWCDKVIAVPAGRVGRRVRGMVAVLAGRSATEGFVQPRALRRAIAAEAASCPFDLVLAYSSGVVPMALSVPAAAHVADLVDADSAKWDAYASTAEGLTRWLYHREARGLGALERRALEACQAVAVVSPAEAAVLGGDWPNLMVVRNGVDTRYFAPMLRTTKAAPSMVFTGTMNYRPNVEAVCWFAREVWPTVRRQIVGAKFLIVGRHPTPAVRQLAQAPGVEVTGAVDDVRPYLAGALVALVPLHLARGVQNKVLEAMAMGRVVIATPQATAGLDLPDKSGVVHAEGPEQWYDAVLSLMRHSQWRELLERSARRTVLDYFQWDASLRPLVEVCKRLCGQPSAQPAVAEPVPSPAAS